jgi:hypothetical protein
MTLLLSRRRRGGTWLVQPLCLFCTDEKREGGERVYDEGRRATREEGQRAKHFRMLPWPVSTGPGDRRHWAEVAKNNHFTSFAFLCLLATLTSLSLTFRTAAPEYEYQRTTYLAQSPSHYYGYRPRRPRRNEIASWPMGTSLNWIWVIASLALFFFSSSFREGGVGCRPGCLLSSSFLYTPSNAFSACVRSCVRRLCLLFNSQRFAQGLGAAG